jgi:hypothetical protein
VFVRQLAPAWVHAVIQGLGHAVIPAVILEAVFYHHVAAAEAGHGVIVTSVHELACKALWGSLWISAQGASMYAGGACS